MQIPHLSKRLEKVASFIPKHSFLADIGTDHAYLPVYVVINGIAKQVIAGEVSDGPFEIAKQHVKKHQLEHLIEVRKGNGLDVIGKEDIIDCITIAGMGGSLISNILEQGKEKLTHVKRLILQPNIAAISIRKWLINNNWELKDEDILKEDGHIYEILVAEKGNPLTPYKENEKEKELLFGPYLLKEKNDVFQEKWKREYMEWQNIYRQLQHAKETEEIHKKKEELVNYMKWYEEEFR